VQTVGVDGGSGTCGGGAAQPSDVTIDVSSRQQRITGFGNSSAWGGTLNNAASDPDTLWSTTTGAGLSMLRIRFGDGLGLAKAAAQRGVTVWMTPWGTGSGGSPGGADTTSQTNPNGCKGTMPVLSNGQDLANNLVTWVQNAKSQGVPIYAVSAENEPDSCGINQTTSYSPAQLATWIATYLGPAMANIGVKVMAPETQNGCGFPGYFSAIQGSSAAWNAVSIFASHEYGCGTLPTEPSIAAAGKEYWETEVDTGAVNGDADGMPSALNLAQTIHADLTKANLNAWHYWWMYAGATSGLYDTTTKMWRKALWVMGNFSRFVRPGYLRVSTSGNPPSGVAVSAYVNPSSGALVIVAINKNTSPTTVPLYVSGSAPCTLNSWETSANNNLAQGSSVSMSNSRVSLTLTGQSVTTFVGMP
jgi:glucuronoarabinoxylan endo-1,4-beta-xylanase